MENLKDVIIAVIGLIGGSGLNAWLSRPKVAIETDQVQQQMLFDLTVKLQEAWGEITILQAKMNTKDHEIRTLHAELAEVKKRLRACEDLRKVGTKG